MPNWKKLIVSGSDASLNNLTVNNNITASDVTVVSSSLDYVQVNDTLQGNGSGFQFFAFNEDTSKVKFANWYTSPDNQYGMGMLWYETYFAAIDTDGNADDVNRRIGFYLEQPEAGATDSTSGQTGRHPNNARFYVDVNGGYLSGSFNATNAITASIISASTYVGVPNITSDFTDNQFLVADGTGGVTSTDALAVDSSGNLGIGTSTPEVRLHMEGDGPQTVQIRMEQYNDTADAPDIRTRRGRGTAASPSDVQTGDYLFRLNVEGRDGGADVSYGSMQFDVDGTDQDAANYRIQTRDTNGTLATRMEIDNAGDVEFTGDLTVDGLSINQTLQATNFTGSFLRLDENGTGLRMTNIGAFDNSSGNFRIFANEDLVFSTNGNSNTRLTIDQTSGHANFTGAVTASAFTGDGSALTNISPSSFTFRDSISGADTYTINHNLNEDYPIVQVYDSGKSQVIPGDVVSIDQDNIEISFDSNFSGVVVVKK